MTRTKSALAIREMTMKTIDVRACVNRFLLSQVGSHFAAGEPELDAANAQWRVPVLIITSGLIVGEVGEAMVAQQTREIISHTAIEQMHAAAGELRKQHHAEIEAAFLHARKGGTTMVVKVTENGVMIPKKLLNGAEEVEIRRERNLILVILKCEEDPIFKLGAEPVDCSLPDASENLDRYLYGNGQ